MKSESAITTSISMSLFLLLWIEGSSPNTASAYVVWSPSFRAAHAMTPCSHRDPLKTQPFLQCPNTNTNANANAKWHNSATKTLVILGNRNTDSDESSSKNANNNNDNEDEEIFTPTTRPNYEDYDDEGEVSNANNYMDDLTPPPVNFARNSILFSENPSTKLRNNPPLEVWRFSRTYLPAVITGAWPWRDIEMLDERPLAALYNALLVRMPVLAVSASYLYQKIAEGHDLVIDLGFDSNGPQAVPPVLVIAVLVLILL